MKPLLLLLTALLLLPVPHALAEPGSPEFEKATQFFNSGQYPQAADGFIRELQTNPQDALSHYYLGLCFHSIGRYPEATREYNWILLHTQDPELIKRVQLGLQALASAPPAPTQLPMPPSTLGQIANPAPSIRQPPTPTAFTAPTPTAYAAATPTASAATALQSAPTAAEMQQAFQATQSNQWVPVAPAIMQTLPTTAFLQNPDDAAPTIGPTGAFRVVDCYTTWCGWCRKFEPTFKKAQSKYRGRIVFERIDAEAPANQNFVKTYKVHSYPTLLFFGPDGRLVQRINGCPQGPNAFDDLIVNTFGGGR